MNYRRIEALRAKYENPASTPTEKEAARVRLEKMGKALVEIVGENPPGWLPTQTKPTATFSDEPPEWLDRKPKKNYDNFSSKDAAK